MRSQPALAPTVTTQPAKYKSGRSTITSRAPQVVDVKSLGAFERHFNEARQKVIGAPGFIDRLRSIPQAREVLGGISHGKFYGEVSAGRLPLTKIGSRSFVADSDLAAYLAATITASRQTPEAVNGQAT